MDLILVDDPFAEKENKGEVPPDADYRIGPFYNRKGVQMRDRPNVFDFDGRRQEYENNDKNHREDQKLDFSEPRERLDLSARRP